MLCTESKSACIPIFNTTCKTTIYVVSLSYGERTTVFVPLFFCPFALKKGAEMRKIPSEVVKILSELVRICSGKITNLSDLRIASSAKKLFCSLTVKSFGREITLKMKRRKTGTILRGRETVRIDRPGREINLSGVNNLSDADTGRLSPAVYEKSGPFLANGPD